MQYRGNHTNTGQVQGYTYSLVILGEGVIGMCCAQLGLLQVYNIQ